MNKQQLVQRVCELALGSSHEPMSIAQLSRLIGVSRRKMQYCFQDCVGMSPAAYLRMMRLNAVRTELRQSVTQSGVHDVATRWGFWHLSQFATDYKKQFGELPSTTLRNVSITMSKP